jgi:hypothetical protein
MFENIVKRKAGRPLGVKDKNSSIYKIKQKGSPSKNASSFKNGTSFKKGWSGGPGRPVGSRNSATIALEQMGEENAYAVYAKLVELALEGDVNACKLIIDRVYPPRKGLRVNLEYSGTMDTVQDINMLSKHVLGKVLSGGLSPEEGEEYGKLCEQRLKIITDTDVMNKIEETYQKVDAISMGAE